MNEHVPSAGTHKLLARIPISVRWRDMDSMGHVNNAKYISYLEEARVRWMLGVLHRLRDEGNTVVVIEHNLDVIKTADQVIDLGPEGGHRGGQIIATGTPEQIAANPASHTGRFLAKLLPASKAATGSKPAATAKPDVLPPRKNPRKKASA